MRGLFTALSRRRDRFTEEVSQPLHAVPRDAVAVRDDILLHGLTADRARQLGDALEAGGHAIDAIEVLSQANRLRRDVALERRLVRLRRSAFRQLDRSLPPPPWPPVVPEDAPGAAAGRPRRHPRRSRRAGCATASFVTAASWCGARSRRLASRGWRSLIDSAFEAHDATVAGRATPDMAAWFDPLEDVQDADLVRDWSRRDSGVFVADSPRGCSRVPRDHARRGASNA